MKTKQTAARRKRLSLFGWLCAIAVAFASLPAVAHAEQPGDILSTGDILSRDSVLRDPEIPSSGNPKGDLTVVEYFDYQCPYCKKMAPELAQLVREDGNIRIVFKDWPIFGPISTLAAKLVLAAKYQSKYAEAHDALIGANKKLTETNIPELLAQAGIDVAVATKDLQTHQKSIDALLARNSAQAEAFGFQGTPGFIVGTFRVPGMVEMDMFKQAVADARAAAKKRKS
jgi:protein-disulfide isomerase